MKLLKYIILALAFTASAFAVDATVVAGKSAKFDVTVEGTAPFTYEWQKATSSAPTVWVKIADAPNASSYTTPKLTTVGTEFYRVVVSNVAGATNSDTANITISPSKPVIITFGVTIVDAP